MTLRPTCDDDVAIFRRLTPADRLERMTCRPIVDGKRMPLDERVQNFTFLVDGAPAAWVSLFNFNSRNRAAEFGYGLVEPLRGQRLGQRMLATAFDHFFATTDLNKLQCRTASFNIPSVRMLESLGLTRDGVLRAEHELDGELFDEFIYSLLRHEWLERQQ
jgi:ribosomal-protein-alanine N-acetyltransferase